MLDQLAASLIRDLHVLDQAEILQRQVRQHQTRQIALPDETGIATMISRFLTLQRGRPYDPAANSSDIRQSQAALAHYYMKDTAGRHRNLRGLLMDAELQATRPEQRDIRQRSRAA